MVDWISQKTLPYMKEHGRKLEHLMILHLFENHDDDILNELKTYQNEDGGFGHGLEPDSLVPNSCVVHTNVAIDYLKQIHDDSKKEPFIKQIVSFFESSYLPDYKGWYLTRKEVDNYPHAFWWNFETIEAFTYGNPTPQVVGFLYTNRTYMNHLDITILINDVITYIKGPWLQEVGDHSLMSTLKFYEAMPTDIQEQIKPYIEQAMKQVIATDPTTWKDYVCEPYKVIPTKDALGYQKYKEILHVNLKQIQESIMTNGFIEPNWHWGQFETEWETIAKPAWTGALTYTTIRQLKEFSLL